MSVASTKTCNSHVGPIVGPLEQTHTGEEKILSHTLVKYCKAPSMQNPRFALLQPAFASSDSSQNAFSCLALT